MWGVYRGEVEVCVYRGEVKVCVVEVKCRCV